MKCLAPSFRSILAHGKGNFHSGGPRLPIITGNRYCIFTMVFHKCECATLNHAFLDVAWFSDSDIGLTRLCPREQTKYYSKLFI